MTLVNARFKFHEENVAIALVATLTIAGMSFGGGVNCAAAFTDAIPSVEPKLNMLFSLLSSCVQRRLLLFYVTKIGCAHVKSCVRPIRT